MNDMPGWGPEAQPPVPPPPDPPTVPNAPVMPAYGTPAPQASPYPPPQAPYQGQPAAPYPQQGYGAMAAPYGAAPYGGMVSPTPPGKGLQIASLVLGILSLIVFLSWIALICGILAIILGAVGRSKAKKVGAPTALGTAGIVCGAIGVVVLIGLIVLAIVYVSSYDGIYFG